MEEAEEKSLVEKGFSSYCSVILRPLDSIDTINDEAEFAVALVGVVGPDGDEAGQRPILSRS